MHNNDKTSFRKGKKRVKSARIAKVFAFILALYIEND